MHISYITSNTTNIAYLLLSLSCHRYFRRYSKINAKKITFRKYYQFGVKNTPTYYLLLLNQHACLFIFQLTHQNKRKTSVKT